MQHSETWGEKGMMGAGVPSCPDHEMLKTLHDR